MCPLRRRYQFAGDAIGFPGPDVVGSDAEDLPRQIVEHVADERQDVVVGRCADIDDVVGAFESLVARGIPEQAIGALDDRQHLLARRRRVAADDVLDADIADEVVADRMIFGDDAAGIADMGGDREIEIGAGC